MNSNKQELIISTADNLKVGDGIGGATKRNKKVRTDIRPCGVVEIFEKQEDDVYKKYQDTIVQHFHKIKVFQNITSLKLVEKQTFSLYDTEDKTLLNL